MIQLIKSHNFDFNILRNPICLIGMPGLGDIGKFAIDQLIGLLDATKAADIISSDFPAGAIVDASIINTPKAELYYVLDPAHKQDIILLTADAQPMSSQGIYELANFICDLFSKIKIRFIISFGAYPIETNSKEGTQIYISTTESGILEDFLIETNCKTISKGIIIGINGLIPSLAKLKYDIEGIVLLAALDNANIESEYFNLSASVELIRLISEKFGIYKGFSYDQSKIFEMQKKLTEKRKEIEEELGISNTSDNANISFYG